MYSFHDQNLLKPGPPTIVGPVAVITPGLVWIPGEMGSASPKEENPGLPMKPGEIGPGP